MNAFRFCECSMLSFLCNTYYSICLKQASSFLIIWINSLWSLNRFWNDLLSFPWFSPDWVRCMCAKSLQSCLTLCDTMDCNPPGSSVHGILQARILAWVPMPSSRGSSWPRDQTCIYYTYLHWQVGSLPLAPPGKPQIRYTCWAFPFLSISLYTKLSIFPFSTFYFSTTAHRLWAPWQLDFSVNLFLPIRISIRISTIVNPYFLMELYPQHLTQFCLVKNCWLKCPESSLISSSSSPWITQMVFSGFYLLFQCIIKMLAWITTRQ